MRISDWSSDVCSSDLCGHAHALACAHAIAAARGDDVRHHTEAKRDLLWAELAVAHAWRSSIDWPGLLGQPPQLVVLRQLIAVAERLRTLAQAPSAAAARSEEHTSELQSLMRISYAVFCLKKKTSTTQLHARHRASVVRN